MEQKHSILIVDDEPMARITMESLLMNEPYELLFAVSGAEALEMAAAHMPDIILLDVMLPGMDGFEVCRRLRALEQVGEVPILMITTLDDRDARLRGIRAGADDYIPKPFDRLELQARLQGITRLNRYRKLAEQRYELAVLNNELVLSYDKTIEGWAQALDLRDKETEGHTQRVISKTVYLAVAFGITDDNTLQHIRRGALLHDVGKLGIPDAILLKPGALTPEEWDVMRLHPIYAYQWLSPIPFLQPALDIPYCHHERWDGTGYPRGLTGEEIPIAARLFAVVDIWDAITSDRPYRKALGRESATRHIESLSGTHLDPQVVSLFLAHVHDL